MSGASALRAAAIAFLAGGAALSCARPPADGDGATLRAGTMRFTVIAPECIRIESQPEGRFVDAPSLFAAARGAGPAAAGASGGGAPRAPRVERDGRRLTIDTGPIRLVYTDDGKPPGPGNLQAEIRGGSRPIVWTPGAPPRGNLGGALKALGGVRAPVDLGQGILSRDGWFLLDDSASPLFTADGWIEARPKGSGTDWYLFGYGRDYGAALRALAAAAGPVPLPRRAALGSWYSRYWPLADADFRRIVEEYRQHDFPLDILVMDTDWHRQGWTGWSWDRARIPDPEGLLAWLHGRGLEVTLNLHHFGSVAPHEDVYPDFMRRLGLDPATRRTAPFDGARREYLEALFDHAVAPLEKAGVDFFWIDWQQLPSTRLPGLSNLAWLNDRHFRRARAHGRRGQILSRWAGFGDHRNVMHFTGDADATWEVLRFQVPYTATAGNAGAFFVSHDIGGHLGARDPEMFTRWVQFGAMSAALRLHSTRAADLDRRPWIYGRPWEPAMREAFHWRARLFPYLYSSAWRAHRDMVPLLRPPYFAAPSDDHAYANPQEYLLGEALLVAPIAEPGVGAGRVATQVVWFPPGRWRGWFTGEAFEGGTEAIVAAAIDEWPLFVREGTPIPMQAVGPRMAGDVPAEITIRCWPGAPGAFTLYEDDGVSEVAETGDSAITSIACARKESHVEVTIGGAAGRFPGMPERRAYVVEVAGTGTPAAARVDGRAIAVERDEPLGITRVRVPARPIGAAVTVEVAAPPADDAVFGAAAADRRAAAARAAAGAPEQDAAEILGAAWAAQGVGLQRRREAPYMFGGADRLLAIDRTGRTRGPVVLTVEERAGAMRREVLRREAERLGTLSADLPPFPAIRDPPSGVPLLRTARLACTIDGRPVTLAKLLDRQESLLRRWRLAGPFPYAPGTPLADQRHLPERHPAAPAAPPGGPEGPGGWRRAEVRPDGSVDLRALWDADGRIAYGLAVLRSPRRQKVTLRAWSDDGIEIWLNGEKIHSHDVVRGLAVGPDVARGALAAGRNVLLVKVSNAELGWAFRVGIEAEEPIVEIDEGAGT